MKRMKRTLDRVAVGVTRALVAVDATV